MSENTIPRRARIDQWTPAERAIYDAKQAVEAVGAHPLLTQAVILLGQAQDKLADFVDWSRAVQSERKRADYASEGAAHFASCQTCREEGYRRCETGELYATSLGFYTPPA